MSSRPTPARRVVLPLAAIATSLLVACQSRPAPETAARAYLEAWHRTDYAAMYALLLYFGISELEAAVVSAIGVATAPAVVMVVAAVAAAT